MALSRSSLEFIEQVISNRAGLDFNRIPAVLVEPALLPVARSLKLSSVMELMRRMESGSITNSEESIVEALADKETYFFRDLPVFETLKKSVLPDLISKRSVTRKLSIWSVGCSSGQEAYSIAILIREAFPELLDWEIEIVGCDVASGVLEYGRNGRYNQLELNRGLPAALMVKYFEKDRTWWRIQEEVRRTVQFRLINAVEQWPSDSGMDLLLVRNLLSLLTEPAQMEVLKSASEHLAADGYLVLGQKERIIEIETFFDPMAAEKAQLFKPKAALASTRDSGFGEERDLAQDDWVALVRSVSWPTPERVDRISKLLAANENFSHRLLGAAGGTARVSANSGEINSDLARLDAAQICAVAMTAPVQATFVEAFDEMSVPLTANSLPAADEAWPKQICIGITMSGKLNGWIRTRLQPHSAARVAAALLGVPETEILPEMLPGVLGPLINCAGLKLKECLERNGFDSNFTSAEVVESAKQPAHSDAALETLSFQCAGEPLLVEAAITA